MKRLRAQIKGGKSNEPYGDLNTSFDTLVLEQKPIVQITQKAKWNLLDVREFFQEVHQVVSSILPLTVFEHLL